MIAPHVAATSALWDLPSDLPVVAVEAGPEDGVPVVDVDQYQGARLATEHLLDLGHATVHHLAGPPDWIEAQQRIEGWRDALEAAGARGSTPLRGDWSPRSGYELGRQLLERPTSPRSSSPTTRWRSACCARSTSRAATCPATSA